jgi:hypothetical protein
LDIIGHKDDRLVSKTSIFGRAILHVADSVKATIQKKLDLAVDDGVKATLVALTPDRASACSDAVTLKARQALRLEQALGSVVLEKDGIRLSATEIGAYAKKQRVEANQEIVLRQGKCAIKLRNNGIEICAPKIQLTGDDVQIRGSRSLKLKSPKTSID